MSFEDFVAGYGRSLVRLAFVLSGDRQVAEDLAQTVLADAYRHWKRVRAAANPEAYVRRMLVNAHLSRRRRRWTTERPADLRQETGATVADPADAVAARDQMRVLLSRLAPRARTVLVLRYYADLDDAAIAAAMGVSESSVRATASRALASLPGARGHRRTEGDPMNQSTERELRELFAADAADAPDELAVAAAAVRRVHRRRRTRTVVAAATTAVIIVAGGYGVHRPGATPRAQPPVASAPAADLPAGVKPGDPLAFGAAQSCVKAYSPETLAENAFAFDGTVTGIGPARTERSPQPVPLDLRSVTFQVHTWFKGGSAGTAAVDMASPAATGTTGAPAYQIGTRLLVSGMPRWGGAPLADAIAWGCGFTRYYSPSMAAAWATATN